MNTLNTFLAYFQVDPTGLTTGARRLPVEIANVGRDDLAACFRACGFTVGVELGVEQGAYAEVLCRANPGVHLYCVDAWRTYPGYRDHVTQAKLDGFFESTKQRLAAFNVTFKRDWSIGASGAFSEGSLDFVFIDANHTLPHVIADLHAWSPKVKRGGIIAGHDFCKRVRNGYQVHVVEAVQAWTQAYQIAPWFVLGRKEVRDGETRDRPRSWCWVKS